MKQSERKGRKTGFKKFPIPIMIRGCFINSNCYSMGNLECHTGQWGGGGKVGVRFFA